MTDFQKGQVECIVPCEIVVEVKVGLFDGSNHLKGVVAGPKLLVLHPHGDDLHKQLCEFVGKVAQDVGIAAHGDVQMNDATWRRRGAALPQEEKTAPVVPDLEDLPAVEEPYPLARKKKF